MALFLLAKCFFLALPASLGTMREQEAWVNHSNIFPISSIQSQERSLKIGNSAQCTSNCCKYLNRRFLSGSEALRQKATMLYTFPGSGNTWMRLLVEYATGIFTGSIYNDSTLIDVLPGEKVCNDRVSLIKVHPVQYPIDMLIGKGHEHLEHRNKCRRGGISNFNRAVLLVRNPFDSIWSEYERKSSAHHDHAQIISEKDFDWSEWESTAIRLSREYERMWLQDYHTIDIEFKVSDVLYLRYEDLVNSKRRFKVLQQTASFLNLTTSDDRLKCAFSLADDPVVHRPKATPDSEASVTSAGKGRVQSVDPMTKDGAYTRRIVCKMWKIFGNVASGHSYSCWKDIDCSRHN